MPVGVATETRLAARVNQCLARELRETRERLSDTALTQTANRAQEGGVEGHAGRGRNAARWLRSLRALLLCWLPAALPHWRRMQRALASKLSSGMPDEHDTALHSTRVQPIRLINLARAGADGPEPRRQVHLDCVLCTGSAILRLAHGG